jgi:hypothetical protein
VRAKRATILSCSWTGPRKGGVSYKEISRAEPSREMRSVCEALSSGRAGPQPDKEPMEGRKSYFIERGGLLLVVNGG